MTEVTTVYDRFTDFARRALVRSRDAAASLGHDVTGTEHLLIGLAQTEGRAGELFRARGVGVDRIRAEVVQQLATRGAATTHGVAAEEALATLGIDVAEVRRRADEAFGVGSFRVPRPAFSLSAKRAVKAALAQARAMGQERIDTEHLLLGVLADERDPGLQVLTAMGIDPAALRRSAQSPGRGLPPG